MLDKQSTTPDLDEQSRPATPLKIVSGGDHRFREFLRTSQSQAEKFGYRFEVFDLGNLGFGRCLDPSYLDGLGEAGKTAGSMFRAEGHYGELVDGYRSRALHKPALVYESLQASHDLVCYLDGDALLLRPIDEIMSDDFDVGLTIRPNGDTTSLPEIAGAANAGVLFFAVNARTRRFVELWMKETQRLKNDQVALNRLLCQGIEGWRLLKRRRKMLRFKRRTPHYIFERTRLPPPRLVGNLRVKFFDSSYNNYERPFAPNARIVHFRGHLQQLFQDYVFLSDRIERNAA